MASADGVEAAERERMEAQEASWALRDVTRAAVDVDYLLARRLGLRPMDYTALGHVFTGEGGVGPQSLAAVLGISSGSASELVDRLERAGHVERRRDAGDRRRVGLAPTEHAVGRVLGELAPLFAALDDLAERYPEPQRAAIVDYLRRAAGVLRDFAADAAPPATPTRP